MIARILTSAALVAGAALLCLPAQAQTGTSATTTINSGGASPTGSVGTTSNTPRNNSSGPMGGGSTNSAGMSSQSPSMGAQGNMQGGGASMNHGGSMNYQAQAGSRHRGDAGERQMTACLNNAASQHQALTPCRR